MCSAKSGPPSSIGLYWSDEELIMFLESMAMGSFLPDDVIADVNPYQYKPSNLPEDVWYFIRTEQKKESEHGFWMTKGEASEIFSNSSVTGLRNTLEFYEGRAPNLQRTNWVMQEYMITPKLLQNDKNFKGSSCLCRVFFISETSVDPKKMQKLDHVANVGGSYLHPKPSVISDNGSSLGLGRSQAKSTGGTTHQHQHHQIEELLDIDNISRGDYLELDDLIDPGSRSSSSDDTSCLTLSSDECFDSLELLKDLEDEIILPEEGKYPDLRCSIVASAKPDEVVIHPATLGSLAGRSHRGQLPDEPVETRCHNRRVKENTTETRNANKGNESTSNSKNPTTSSSSHMSRTEGKRKAPFHRMKKLKRKYLCFMPF